MATIDTYKIKIDVEGQQAVERLKGSLAGLGGIVAGIGFGAFITSAFQMADAMSDLSKATGIGVNQLLAFKSAMQMAGGDSKDAGKAIATFFQSIDSAAQGTESAQKALERVGITFKDVGNLSETELLNKAVKNLAEMEAGSARTAAGVAIFGKSFRNIDPSTLQEVLKASNYDEAANAINRAADQVDAMQKSFSNLQVATLQALEPIIGKLDSTGLSLQQAEKLVKAVAIALGLAFGLKTVGIIIDVVSAVKALNTALKGTAVIQSALLAMQGPKGWAMLAAGVAAAAGAVYAYNKALEDTPEEVKRGRPTMENDPRLIGGGDTGPKRQTQLYTDEELRARRIALVTAQQQTLQLKLQNTEAQKFQSIINSTIGIMDDEAGIIKINAQLQQDANLKLIDLQKQIEVEKNKGRGTNQGIIVELQKQKDEVLNNLNITKQLKQEELNRLDTLERQRNVIRNTAQDIQDGHEDAKIFTQNQIQSQVILGKMTQEQANREKELENIRIDTSKKTEALAAQRILATTQREKDSIDQQIKMAEEREKVLIYNTQQRYAKEDELRNSSIAGARAAMEQITRSVDPFIIAQSSGMSLFSNMNSAIDTFVETGNFKFSDFAESVIKDLLKIQLRAAATSFMSAGLNFLGIPGLASGGPAKANEPYIVGENGPELFIPKMAGTVQPNNQLATNTSAGTSLTPSNTIYNYNISAVDSQSVARLFANNRQTLLGSVRQAEKELPVRGFR